MPKGDRTGPDGMGSRTGRKGGYCSGKGGPGYLNDSAGPRRGMRRHAVGGRSLGLQHSLGGHVRGRPELSGLSPQEELSGLRRSVELGVNDRERINARIRVLEDILESGEEK